MPKTENLTNEQKQIILNQIETILNDSTLDFVPETELQSLGFDSLDFVELIMNLEAKFNIAINDEVCNEITTIQKLYDAVYNSLLESTNK